MSTPKQHHYIPQTYLRGFAAPEGYLSLYDLWNDGKEIRTSPQNMLKERNLYTQPVHAEQRFDTRLETNFADLEAYWPNLVQTVQSKAELTTDQLVHLVQFICMMRVRVKNTLKAATQLLIDFRRATLPDLREPVPENVLVEFVERFPNLRAKADRGPVFVADLADSGAIVVAVDPHRALAAMPNLVRQMSGIVGRRGLVTFSHNETDIDFITSDNPVVYYGDNQASAPYEADDQGHFHFLFPLTPRIAIRYSTRSKRRSLHRVERSRHVVMSMNKMVVRFADRFVVSANGQLGPSLGDSGLCPIPDLSRSRVSHDGTIHQIGYVWGAPIRTLPTWEYDFARAAARN